MDAPHDARRLTQVAPAGRQGRFDGQAYAGATAHHRAYDAAALSGARLRPGARVLDLGCGVGDLTSDVADRVEAGGPADGRVVGVDSSPSCLAVAVRRARPGLTFVGCRAQDVGRVLPAQSFDVVLSVAVLHWVPEVDQPAVLRGLADVLRPDGVLRADLGGAGQIAEVLRVLGPLALAAGAPTGPWFFPTPAQMGALAVEAGFAVDDVRLVRQRRSVPDAAALRGWLVSQVLPAYLQHLPDHAHNAFSTEAVRSCIAATRRPDRSYDQDYVRIHLTAHPAERALPIDVAALPATQVAVADVMAATAGKVDRISDDDALKALLAKRSRRAAAVGRHDPDAALEVLAGVNVDLEQRPG